MKSPIHYIQLTLIAFFMAMPFFSVSQISIAEWNFPNNPDDALVDIFDPINATASLITQGGTGVIGFNQTGATTRSANATNWQSGMNLKWWEVAFSTIGFYNLSVSSKQYSSSTAPRDFKIQYRIGAGLWTDVPAATSITVGANWTSGVVSSVPLPAICENQTSVSLRWIMTTNTSVGGGTVASGGNSRIDDINISWNSDDYYRSVANGNWNNIATWESSANNITWNPSVMPPSSFAKTITIRNTHTVTVSSDIHLDETIIEIGGTLLWSSSNIRINNGPGIDLQVNGTLNDVSITSINFDVSASWQLGSVGTVIKSGNGSANNWRDNYDGGISTIPATANWIIRKINGTNPSVSSLLMYYPNLTVENNTAGTWIATGPSSFQGASSSPVVKGNLNIGGSGISTVEFENTNNNTTATLVLGDIQINSGNTLRNYGTGFEVHGNFIADGDLTYDSNDARQLIFGGNIAQTISGSGNMNVFNLTMNKPANDVTLLKNITVDNSLIFNNPGGRIFTSSTNLITIEDGATVTGTNNSSFVHGPVTKLGTQAFTFPTGKNNDYQSISIGTGTGGTAVFWTDDFSTGCNTGLLATSYAGINGNWSISNTGTNEASANTWYVSAAENGNGSGSCGSGCGSNRTLHVSSTAFGDLGAAYFESDPFTCSFLGLCGITNKRIESPVIDCSGRSTITLSFNYMEYGEGTNDNATLWYFDGSTWSQLSDPGKTLCCGNVICTGSIQGLWTAYSIVLPASADNNPNVRIGFNWTNNGNGVGTDPSFAVDDIKLSSPISSDSFTAEYFYDNPQVVYNNVVNPFIDHISICEYWTLEQNAGSSSRTVTLSWDANSCGVNNLADLTVARFNGLSWDDRGNGGTTGTTASGTITSANAQTQFGPFTLASTTILNPLPVEYLFFESKCKNNKSHLKWITSTEHNSSYFEILKSLNGSSFEVIGTRKAAGNSITQTVYTFEDSTILTGTSYYRLNQVDFDGTSKLSNIVVSVPCKDEFLSIISIHNIDDELNLNIYSGKSQQLIASIFDISGKAIWKEAIFINDGVSSNIVNAQNIAAGLYIIKLESDSEQIIQKFTLVK